MSDPSWRVKLLRAEHHFGHLKLRIASLSPQMYPVSKRFESYDGVQQWVWRLDIPEIDDPELSAIVGDVLFNVRSALDHLAVALIPPERRAQGLLRRAQFPIFTCDVDERDPITGTYLHVKDRRRWNRQTQGLTDDAVAAVKWHQPYNFASQGRDPRDSSLAILSALQNADKHRQLVVTTRGIRDPIAIFTPANGDSQVHPFPVIEAGFIANRTVLDSDPTNVYGDVKMEMQGTPLVFIGESGLGPYREATESLRLIIGNGWVCARRLEPLIP